MINGHVELTERMLERESLLKKELSYFWKETGIYMPNEIFDDLFKELDSFRYVATAYSFYYLYSYMWRYAKYGKEHFNVKKIKNILGINPNLKTVDFIIKKNGVLDKMGYTESVFDYPVKATWDDGFQLHMLSEMVEESPELKPKVRTRQKFPIRGFHRTGDKSKLDGTFYRLKDTHFVHPSTFIRCMSNPDELGVKAFYIAGLIRSKYWDFEDGEKAECYISRVKLSQMMKISANTLHKYTDAMEDYGVINVTHRDYKHNVECLANGYSINNLKKIV